MALTPGARLGAYEVTGLLGAGGMGEVYRARDTKLGREVALKILPEAFAQDPERLAWFEREARTLAALNHPHIAHIYGVEDSPSTLRDPQARSEQGRGATDSGHAGMRALVMELVEGPTLAERVAAGPLPVDDTLAVATQIVEALEAAHEQGIVHRDLKPANIKVRPDGTVKVLDFGLAKALGPPEGGPYDPREGERRGKLQVALPPSQSPTITSPVLLTGAGMILGTAAYMSPEQAKGRPADARSDIWAFGVVLFEMLSGRRAFEGEDVAETLAHVMTQEPAWDALPASTPQALRRLLRKCLERNTSKRLRHIADARFDLAEAASEKDAAPREAPLDQRTVSSNVRLGRLEPALPVLIGVLLGAVGIGGAWWVREPVPRGLDVVRFEYAAPSAKGRIRNSQWSVMAVSPDGRWLAYNTTDGLYLKAMSDLEAQLVPGTSEELTTPFFSPDSQSLAYITVAGALMRVAVTGGQPVRIADGLVTTFGASWSRDDTILVGTREGIARVPASGGSPETLVKATEGERVWGPQLLPDGESILVSVTRAERWNEGQDGEIVVHSLRTGTRTVVIRGGSDARYLSTGHLIYSLRNELLAVGFDLETLTTTVSPVSVVQGVVRSFNSVTGAASYGVADNGSLTYMTSYGVGPSRMRWFTRAGAPEEDVGPPVLFLSNIALSPEEGRVAFGTAIADTGVRVADLRRGVTSQLVTGGSDPAWSPDGRELAYNVAGRGVYIIPADGGDARRVFQPPPGWLFYVEGWHPAGTHMTGVMVGDGIDRGVVIPLSGDQMPVAFDEAPDLDEPHFSPDGRWIAYNAARNGGAMEVYVVPYPPTGERVQISSGGGVQALWRGDGRELYYLTPQGALMAVGISTSEGRLAAGAPTRFFDTGLTVVPIRDQYAVTRDGSRFLIAAEVSDGEPSPARFVVVQNFLEDLRRLVPSQ